MSDKDFLEQMLSMLPKEFQDIYDDTIQEAKEIRKKMGKKVSSVKSYSCAMPLMIWTTPFRKLITTTP